MVVKLINDVDVKVGRGTGKKINRGKRYENYRLATKNILPFLKESLEKSRDGTIRIRTKDIVKEMDKEMAMATENKFRGDKFRNKSPVTLMWGLKFTLFDEGIIVKSGMHKDGSDILIMSKRTENDTLPPSLEMLRKENEKFDKKFENVN